MLFKIGRVSGQHVPLRNIVRQIVGQDHARVGGLIGDESDLRFGACGCPDRFRCGYAGRSPSNNDVVCHDVCSL